MTRLAFGLERLGRPATTRGDAPLTEAAIQRARGHVPERPAVGLPAARRHARPAPDRPPVLRLLRRRHRPLPARRQAPPGHAVGPRARTRQEPERRPAGSTSASSTPTASASRWSRSTRSRRRASRELDDPRTCRRSRRRARPTISQPRIYFGERPSQYVVVDSQQAEFDYPRGNDAAGGDVTTTAGTGTTGIKLDTILSRLLFALRFRDFNLLISDQITNQSQLLFHRSLDDRLPRIAPFLLYDKDPYVVIDKARQADLHPGRLHGRAIASRTPRRSIPATWARPASAAATVQLHPEQRQGRHGRLRRDDDLLRQPTRTTRSSGPGRASSRRSFKPMSEFPTDLRPHLRVPEELFNVQTRMYGRYHVTDPQTFYASNDLWTVPTGQTSDAEPPERGLLRDDAAARGRTAPSSCSSSR